MTRKEDEDGVWPAVWFRVRLPTRIPRGHRPCPRPCPCPNPHPRGMPEGRTGVALLNRHNLIWFFEGGAALPKLAPMRSPTQNGRARVEFASSNNSVFAQNIVHHNERKAATHSERGHAGQSGLLAKLALEVTDLKCDFTAIN